MVLNVEDIALTNSGKAGYGELVRNFEKKKFNLPSMVVWNCPIFCM